jgi:6-pyruvoyltetrahydropterin/6-carboxytetrahydropterin synthase
MKITKRIEFDAGHRLVKHESKCANLHGHRYAVEVELTLLLSLDDVGRILDFSEIKSVFGKWIDDNLDHAFIVNVHDPIVDAIISSGKYFIVEFEPTAENLSLMLLNKAQQLLDCDRFKVSRIKLWETPTSTAEVTA